MLCLGEKEETTSKKERENEVKGPPWAIMPTNKKTSKNHFPSRNCIKTLLSEKDGDCPLFLKRHFGPQVPPRLAGLKIRPKCQVYRELKKKTEKLLH